MLIGVHGRNQEQWREIDFAVVGKMGIQVLKMMSHTSPEVFGRLKKENPDLQFIVRLYWGGAFGKNLHPIPQDFTNQMIPVIGQLKQYTKLFQIHNEPNHLMGYEGWGDTDEHAKSFNVWFLEVYRILKEKFPDCQFGFPGLAVPHRDLEWLDICAAAIHKSDWLGCHCFTGESFVTMADGSVKQIKDVKKGDGVVTHTGEIKKVLQKSERDYSGKLFRVEPIGVDEFYCTSEHPLYIRRRTASRKYLQEMKPEEWLEVDKCREGDLICYPRMKHLPNNKFTEDQLWVLGLWLAEGSVGNKSEKVDDDYYTLVFTMHRNEKWILEKARNILRGWFNKETGSIHVKDNTAELHFSGIEITRLFIRLLGKNAKNKKLHKSLFLTKGLLPLIQGFLDGDGTVKPDNSLTLYTSSVSLAYQLKQIMINEGRYANIKRVKRNEFINPAYYVEIRPHHAIGLYSKNKPDNGKKRKRVYSWGYELKDSVWYPIRNLDWYETQIGETIKVYNLEVEDNHSYLVNGVAVHNCYWQNPPDINGANHTHVFWGLKFTLYHDRYPNKDIHILEAGNSNHQSGYPSDEEIISNELIDWFKHCQQYDYVKSTSPFILSSPDPSWESFAWVANDGRYKPIVYKVKDLIEERMEDV